MGKFAVTGHLSNQFNISLLAIRSSEPNFDALEADTSKDGTSTTIPAAVLQYGIKQADKVNTANGQPSFRTIGLASSLSFGVTRYVLITSPNLEIKISAQSTCSKLAVMKSRIGITETVRFDFNKSECKARIILAFTVVVRNLTHTHE